MGRLKDGWVVVAAPDRLVRSKNRREFACHDPRTGEWNGWTTPGYRTWDREQRDCHTSLREAMGLLRQVREKYNDATLTRISWMDGILRASNEEL